jgi:formylglycine-generating enzyme required for sulfatase activity
MKLVMIAGGSFLMGSPESDRQAWNPSEFPYHRVSISRPFYLGVYEVTQGQYKALIGANPSHFHGSDDLPVENLSWTEAIAFCNKLSNREGLTPCYRSDGERQSGGEGYRLPTEAEWEYACRAGSTTKFNFGEDWSLLGEFAWYRSNSESKTHPVGQKRPNAWGLYDMNGNALEWCWDWYGHNGYVRLPPIDPQGPDTTDSSSGANLYGAFRVYRGGSWDNGPRNMRSAARGWRPKEQYFDIVGLRVVRVPSEKGSGNR